MTIKEVQCLEYYKNIKAEHLAVYLCTTGYFFRQKGINIRVMLL